MSASSAATAAGLVDCGVFFAATAASGVTTRKTPSSKRASYAASPRAPGREVRAARVKIADDAPGDLVRGAERQAAANEVVGDFGGEQQARRGRPRHLGSQRQRPN